MGSTMLHTRLIVEHRVRRSFLAASLLAIASALLPMASLAGQSLGTLVVTRAWSRSTPPGISVGVAYFEIVNSGAADTLLSIESPLAQRVEMHATTTVDGLMQMRQVQSAAVPPGGRVVFEPSGLHAMLIGLKQPLKEGERLPLTLIFRHAGTVRVEAVIRGLGTETPSARQSSSSEYRLSVWPQHAPSPDFKLTDFDGRPRTLADYRGHVVVVFFGFVRCPDACPAELFKLALVMKQLGELSEQVRVLFVTLDPERDTPTVLKSYLTAFDPRFVGLRGTNGQIERAAANFYVEYARVGTGADYTLDHSTSTFVLDGGGHLRLVGGMTTNVADFAHDLTALAMQGR